MRKKKVTTDNRPEYTKKQTFFRLLLQLFSLLCFPFINTHKPLTENIMGISDRAQATSLSLSGCLLSYYLQINIIYLFSQINPPMFLLGTCHSSKTAQLYMLEHLKL